MLNFDPNMKVPYSTVYVTFMIFLLLSCLLFFYRLLFGWLCLLSAMMLF